MPFVITLLPMLGLSFLADESFHQLMVVVCLGLAAAGFIPGIQRHRRLLPIGVASVGLLMIATAAFALEGQCCVACETSTASVMTGHTAETCQDASCELCAVQADHEQDRPRLRCGSARPLHDVGSLI